jgi:hypothetical protein
MDFPGEAVLHCHFLRHEDLGMMDTILVVDGYRPGYVPTPGPTASGATPQVTNSPTHDPTKFPIPSPSKQPIPSPTQEPTKKPAAEPTKSPYPRPTSQPTHNPTHDPTPKPTFNPSIQPTPQPTPEPSHTFAPTSGTHHPTKQPVPYPTTSPSTSKPSITPTSSPTLLPSLSDTFTLSVSMIMSADDDPTDENEATLITLIANQTDVDESNINNFDMTYSGSNRRRTRHLLSETWDVSFDITVSLTSTGESTELGFQTFVESALSESSFQNKVTSEIPSVLSIYTVLSTIETRHPSPVPTSKKKNSNDDDDIVAANFTFLLAGVGIVLLICCGCCVFCYRYLHNNPYEKHDDDGAAPAFNWRSSFGRNSSAAYKNDHLQNNNTRPAVVGKTASGFNLTKSTAEFNWRSSFGRNKKKQQEEMIREMTKTSFQTTEDGGIEPVKRKSSLLRTSFNPMMPPKFTKPPPPPPPNKPKRPLTPPPPGSVYPPPPPFV